MNEEINFVNNQDGKEKFNKSMADEMLEKNVQGYTQEESDKINAKVEESGGWKNIDKNEETNLFLTPLSKLEELSKLNLKDVSVEKLEEILNLKFIDRLEEINKGTAQNSVDDIIINKLVQYKCENQPVNMIGIIQRDLADIITYNKAKAKMNVMVYRKSETEFDNLYPDQDGFSVEESLKDTYEGLEQILNDGNEQVAKLKKSDNPIKTNIGKYVGPTIKEQVVVMMRFDVRHDNKLDFNKDVKKLLKDGYVPHKIQTNETCLWQVFYK